MPMDREIVLTNSDEAGGGRCVGVHVEGGDGDAFV